MTFTLAYAAKSFARDFNVIEGHSLGTDFLIGLMTLAGDQDSVFLRGRLQRLEYRDGAIHLDYVIGVRAGDDVFDD
jgi:hypothetical protein